MKRKLISFLLFIFLIILLLLGTYFINQTKNIEELDTKKIINLESTIVEGNGHILKDNYIDPLDLEISELNYNDNSQDSDGNIDALKCSDDIECGNDFSEESYCIGDKVYEKVHEFSCNGRCNENINRKLIEECFIGCFEGECINSFLFDCEFDFECGINDFVGDTFCSLDNVYQDYLTWTCLDPGTENSTCNISFNEQLVDDCGTSLGCNEGMCIN
tara:strand:- start:307 stop:957 length:651 start_codon:yes stop_codon:yes gene_type:complete